LSFRELLFAEEGENIPAPNSSSPSPTAAKGETWVPAVAVYFFPFASMRAFSFFCFAMNYLTSATTSRL